MKRRRLRVRGKKNKLEKIGEKVLVDDYDVDDMSLPSKEPERRRRRRRRRGGEIGHDNEFIDPMGLESSSSRSREKSTHPPACLPACLPSRTRTMNDER